MGMGREGPASIKGRDGAAGAVGPGAGGDGQVPPAPAAAPPALTLRNLRVAYPGATAPVLSLPSLEFAKGSFTCILGRSGCGKSTLLNCIAGLVKPAGGDITWHGDGQLGDRVGMVFQEAGLFPWMDALGNVTIALRRVAGSRAEKARLAGEALSSVGLGAFAKRYPGQLSGGMKQRVVLARYLAAECELLLMDEPFSGLDQFGREEMQDLLIRLYMERGMTCVFVTHSLVEATYLGSRVVVLGGSPAGVVDDVAIPDPYPRSPESRVSSEGAEVRERLYAALRPAKAGPDERPQPSGGGRHAE